MSIRPSYPFALTSLSIIVVHFEPVLDMTLCAANLHKWRITLLDKMLLWLAADDEPRVMSTD